jgi:hypothetical protein
MEMTTYLRQVVADAERAFGPDTDAASLECYAREAVLELWLTRARVTVYVAELALREVRDEIERRVQTAAARPHRTANYPHNPAA